jgi:hypothetical protein
MATALNQSGELGSGYVQSADSGLNDSDVIARRNRIIRFDDELRIKYRIAKKC